MMELIAEMLTGESKLFFENDAMRWGTETEPQARFMYELKSGNTVEEVAFIERSDFIGVSPDGLIGEASTLIKTSFSEGIGFGTLAMEISISPSVVRVDLISLEVCSCMLISL